MHVGKIGYGGPHDGDRHRGRVHPALVFREGNALNSVAAGFIV